MFKGPKKQRGMTGLGWLLVIFLICFFSFVGITLFPVYMENYSIKSVVEAVKQEPNVAKKSTSQIRTMIRKRLIINSIRDLKKEHIIIKKFAGNLTVKIEYEVRKPLFGNLDVVMAFKDEFEMAAH
jgi:hypothetical protein